METRSQYRYARTFCAVTGVAVVLSAPPVLAAQTAGTVQSVGDRVIEAVEATGPLRVDGVLDERAWIEVPLLDAFRQVDPDYLAVARAPSEVRVTWNGAGLYVGAALTDPPGGGVERVEGMRRDFAYGTSDLFGVVLDGFGDGRFAMGFFTNPKGAQLDQLIFDGTDDDPSWNGVWRVRTSETATGWTAEFFIPWATLRYRAGGDPWRINFVREARALQETSGWAPWQRGVDPWDMTFAGTLEGIEPPSPGLNLQVQPYTVGLGENASASPDGEARFDPDAGLDVKWAIRPGSVLDITVNTDFAQAEVDRQVVNLERFPVFFPERRTFFLESAGLFDTGLDVVSPFYSRRIGLDDQGLPVPITAGARLTSRTAKSSAGGLVVRQAGVGESDGSVFAMGRYVRNVGWNGRVGALTATRFDEGLEPGASALNSVAAVDYFVRPTRTLFSRGMVSRSFTEGPGGDGWAAHAIVGNTATWGYVGWLQEYIGGEWEPRSGFAFDRDVLVTSPAATLDLRPSWLPASVRSLDPGFIVFLFHRASTGRFFSGSVGITPLSVLLQDGSSFSIGLTPEWQRFAVPFRPVPGIDVDAGDYYFNRWNAEFAYDPSARISGSVGWEGGRFYDGSLQTGTVSAKVALIPEVVALASWEHNRFSGFGDGVRTTDLLTPEIRLAATPRLELAGIWQYNTALEASSLNLRFSWEFRPLSFLYVVYNDNASLSGSPTPVEPRRQLIIKGTWLWQPS